MADAILPLPDLFARGLALRQRLGRAPELLGQRLDHAFGLRDAHIRLPLPRPQPALRFGHRAPPIGQEFTDAYDHYSRRARHGHENSPTDPGRHAGGPGPVDWRMLADLPSRHRSERSKR